MAVRLDPCDDFGMPQHEVDLRTLVAEQAALNRVAVTVATETAAERVFDVVTEEVARLLGADAANLVRFSPTRDEGVIVGKWSEPGVPDPGRRHDRRDRGRQRAHQGRADGSAGSPGHGRPRRSRGAPRAADRAWRDVSRRSADRRVGRHLGRRRRVAHRRTAVSGERRGATRAVCRPRRRRTREHAGPRGARNPGRRAGCPQPRRGRRRDRGGSRAALQRRLGGDRPVVRRAFRCDRALRRRCGRGGDRGRLGAGRPLRRPPRRTPAVSGRRDRARREDRSSRADRPGERAARRPGAHGRGGCELRGGGSDRCLRATLGLHLDLAPRVRAIPTRRRGSPREVHEPRRCRARKRGGPRSS